MIRKNVHYTGRVQGVGFRATARDIARDYNVTGFVRNLPDGRVEIVVEGSSPTVNSFLDELAQTMSRYINSVDADEQPPTEEFRDFTVRH